MIAKPSKNLATSPEIRNVQAYSRTNQILNEVKSQGNIVVFRNLKKATDEAVALFSNKEAKETIFVPPYDEYVE